MVRTKQNSVHRSLLTLRVNRKTCFNLWVWVFFLVYYLSITLDSCQKRSNPPIHFEQSKILQNNTSYTFQNKSISFALIRCQYLLVMFLGLLWVLLVSLASLLCNLQFDFIVLISHLYQATSLRADQPTNQQNPLYSSLHPFCNLQTLEICQREVCTYTLLRRTVSCI